MSSHKSVKATLRQSLREQGSLNDTYKTRIDVYFKWAKEHGLKYATVEQVVESIPDYISYRSQKWSASTIHTDVAALCKACSVSMSDYPTLYRGQPTKGRIDARNDRTEANARVIAFAQCVGIRKDEYRALRGSDYITRGDDAFVVVRKGKGGKRQEQYIQPEDRDFVRSYFDGTENYIFSKAEMKACQHANLHGIRRDLAQKNYQRYCQELTTPEAREHMKDRLQEVFDRNPQKAGRFNRDMMDKPYTTRGKVRNELIALHKPITYDRLALMAVSVFHLAHYREDVTVKNYMK